MPSAASDSPIDLASLAGRFVQATGTLISVAPEPHPDPDLADHLYLHVDAGPAGPLRFALNTRSRRNELAGFDSRIRVAVSRQPVDSPPAAGVNPHPPRDYNEIESRVNLFYEYYEQEELQRRLIEDATHAAMAIAWGILYHRNGLSGVHQMHACRASCAVKEDIRGLDGGLALCYRHPTRLKIYYFKFCGQP